MNVPLNYTYSLLLLFWAVLIQFYRSIIKARQNEWCWRLDRDRQGMQVSTRGTAKGNGRPSPSILIMASNCSNFVTWFVTSWSRNQISSSLHVQLPFVGTSMVIEWHSSIAIKSNHDRSHFRPVFRFGRAVSKRRSGAWYELRVSGWFRW